MPVDVSVYQNQPNPLGQITSAYGIMNANQQLQLGQQAQQIRQYELQQSQAKGLYDTIAPLVNSPGITQAQVRAAGANYARQVGMPAQSYQNFDQMLSGPDWQTNLKNLAIRSQGPAGITARTNVVDPSGATSAVPSPSIIGQGVPTGLPLTAAPSIQKMQGDLNTVGNFSQEIVPWNQMNHYLSQLPEGSMGPGSEGRQHLEEGLFALSPTLAKFAGVSPDKITNYGAFAKYAAQAANRVGGSGTDLSLMQTITGNPNPKINDLTDRQLVQFGTAVMRMGAAQTVEASKSGPNAPIGSNGANYINKKASLSSTLDPRAFMFDLLTPAQRANLNTSLSGRERDNYNRSIDIALRNKLMGLPGQ
jgi:hypothetical protein